jgi:hypothetical protein
MPETTKEKEVIQLNMSLDEAAVLQMGLTTAMALVTTNVDHPGEVAILGISRGLFIMMTNKLGRGETSALARRLAMLINTAEDI